MVKVKIQHQYQTGWVSPWFLVGGVLVAFMVGFIMGAIVQHRRGISAKIGQDPRDEVAAVLEEGVGRPRVVTKDELGQLRALEERAERNPNNAEAWIDLGNLNYDLGRAREAIRAYERALALKPGDPDVITDMGTMYRAIGEPRKAVELYREARRMDPNHLQSLYKEGVVLLHDMNDLEGAARAWEEFVKAVPQGEQAEKIRWILESLKAQIGRSRKMEPGD